MLAILPRLCAVMLVDLAVVDFLTKHPVNAFSVALESVCAQLEPGIDSGREFHHETCRHTACPFADPEGRDRLGIGINRNEDVLIA